jgi:hypothetical protein
MGVWSETEESETGKLAVRSEWFGDIFQWTTLGTDGRRCPPGITAFKLKGRLTSHHAGRIVVFDIPEDTARLLYQKLGRWLAAEKPATDRRNGGSNGR